MRLLIDTNVFLWTAFEPRRLSPRAKEALADQSNELLVSVVVALELGMAVNKGRISLDQPIADFYRKHMTELEGARELPFSAVHALAAGGLPYTHRDPMDRMLAAQSVVEGLPIVTSDRLIRTLGVDVVW